MKQRLLIEYDVIDKSVKIAENDFIELEAFGILEAVKMMIASNWFERTEGDEA